MVAAWTAENNISDDAREKLYKEGYTCLDAIKLIEMEDLIKTKIPRGQHKLIFASVQKLNSGQQVAGGLKDANWCTCAFYAAERAGSYSYRGSFG